MVGVSSNTKILESSKLATQLTYNTELEQCRIISLPGRIFSIFLISVSVFFFSFYIQLQRKYIPF